MTELQHSTLKGLHKWYERLMKKAGWVLLKIASKNKNEYSTEIKNFIDSLDEYDKKANAYLNEVQSMDLPEYKKRDLKIVIGHIKRLLKTLNSVEKTVTVDGNRKRRSKKRSMKRRS